MQGVIHYGIPFRVLAAACLLSCHQCHRLQKLCLVHLPGSNFVKTDKDGVFQGCFLIDLFQNCCILKIDVNC